MPTITAARLGTTAPEPVLVTLGALPADGSVYVTVTREVPGEPDTVVHGFDRVVPRSAVLQAPDVAAPMGRPIVYVLEVVTAATGLRSEISTAPVTVTDVGRHVLSSPWSPSGVEVDLVLTDDARVEAARFATFAPAGRRSLVALHDVRSNDAGSLVFYAADRRDADDVRRLLASGSTVVSRHPADGCDVPAVELLFLGDLSRARRDSKRGDRVFTAPAYVVDDPDPLRAVVLVTMLDLATFYTGRPMTALALDYPGTMLDVAGATFGRL